MRALLSHGPSACTLPKACPSDVWNFSVVNASVPAVGDREILLRVAGASVNPVDFKLALDAKSPNGPLGRDVAGTVVAVGSSSACAAYKVGDEVYGVSAPSSGSFAQFALARCASVGRRLAGSPLSLRDHGTLPIGAGTSLEALWKTGAPWAGSRRRNVTVVVTSGAGGTGVFALQLARAMGAGRIVTVARSVNAPLLRSLGATLWSTTTCPQWTLHTLCVAGATEVVDYTRGSVWDALDPDSVDVVYDNYGAPGTAELAMRCLKGAGGVFLFLPGKGGSLSRHPKPGVKQVNYGMFSSAPSTYAALGELLKAGRVRTVVQARYALEQVPAAFSACAEGHVVGKLAVSVGDVERVRRRRLRG